MFYWVARSVRFAIKESKHRVTWPIKCAANHRRPADDNVTTDLIWADVEQTSCFILRACGEVEAVWVKCYAEGRKTIKFKRQFFALVSIVALIELTRAHLLTSAAWPKNVCFCSQSRTSHSLHVRSTDPVINWLPSGANEIETTSPACAFTSDVFLPASKSQTHNFMSPEPVRMCPSSKKRHELRKPSYPANSRTTFAVPDESRLFTS